VTSLAISAPGTDAFLAVAEACRDALPQAFRRGAADVHIIVEEFAADEVLDAFEIDDALDLTGLYTGTPLIEAGAMPEPALIHLYRMPILFEWALSETVTLEELIQHVYIHELGHHFGWSDADMDALLAETD
jgi:predicted Zn-dependent protease with MMP-like domain